MHEGMNTEGAIAPSFLKAGQKISVCTV